MKVRFFSNYCDSKQLLQRCFYNYEFNSKSKLRFTTTDDYDIAVVFNFTTNPLKAKCSVVTIIQEPSWIFSNFKNPFLTTSDYVILHDLSLFPEAKNVQEYPSIMFYHDNVPFEFYIKENSLKRRKLSLIMSNKQMCNGHIKRLNFLRTILESDLDVDIYGRGLKLTDTRYKGELVLKHTGLLPYEFSICVENAVEKNYITEKFIDCVVCNTVPIYYGAPNIKDVYNKGGFEIIDIDDNNVIERIKEITDKGYLHYQQLNLQNKFKYFHEFNIFKLLEYIIY